MNRKINCLFVLSAFLWFSFYGCKSDKPQTNSLNNEDSLEVEVANISQNEVYRLPSPVDLYMFIRENQGTYDKSFLNPSDKIQNYQTHFSRLINFGIYASDLAYCSVFGQSQDSFSYFKTTKTLADDLGYTEGFNEVLVKRIEQSQFNLDTLYQISMDAYWDACTYLEDQGKTDELTLILAGGWIESMHIALHSVKKFSASDEMVGRIADQGMLVKNLLSMFSFLDMGEKEKKLNDQLNDLKKTYDLIDLNGNEVLTQEQFNEISQKLELIRTELTN